MELFSANYEENTRALDDLLGVGRCFDMISRDLYVGGRRARMWVVDGYGDDAVIERMLSFWLPLRDVSNAQTMQQFIDLTLLAVSIGAIIYYIVLQIVLQLGLNTNDLKLITALIVAVFLAIPYWKSKMFRRKVQPQSAKNGGNGHA